MTPGGRFPPARDVNKTSTLKTARAAIEKDSVFQCWRSHFQWLSMFEGA